MQGRTLPHPGIKGSSLPSLSSLQIQWTQKVSPASVLGLHLSPLWARTISEGKGTKVVVSGTAPLKSSFLETVASLGPLGSLWQTRWQHRGTVLGEGYGKVRVVLHWQALPIPGMSLPVSVHPSECVQPQVLGCLLELSSQSLLNLASGFKPSPLVTLSPAYTSGSWSSLRRFSVSGF